MKKIFLLFILIIQLTFSSCNIIMHPVQDERESNKYFRLNEGDTLIQPLPDVSANMKGIVFLASGAVDKLEIAVKSTDDGLIIAEKNILNFKGNVRKTTYIDFGLLTEKMAVTLN